MRLTCPYCGERDLREFTYQGAELALDRPAADAGPDMWDDYLHNRDNPAGSHKDLWYHGPCGTWIVVHRNTVTHAINATQTATDARS
ncbi:sarcosine oxidase subunit delta [Aestuariibius sp. HNIBRBA575]|uniref:sarcosine oxidase subunit delta n=1 Tax=Aestuariibius sp. HNIBRBA575 TaxID=3233343 RepID=UPI0034A27E92